MKIRMIIHVGFLKKNVPRNNELIQLVITRKEKLSFSFLASRVNSIEEGICDYMYF